MKNTWKQTWNNTRMWFGFGAFYGDQLFDLLGFAFGCIMAGIDYMVLLPIIIFSRRNLSVMQHVHFWQKVFRYVGAVIFGVVTATTYLVIKMIPTALICAICLIGLLFLNLAVVKYGALVVTAAVIVLGTIFIAFTFVISALVKKIKRMRAPRRPFQYYR